MHVQERKHALFAFCTLPAADERRPRHTRKAQRRQLLQTEKKIMEVPNSNKIRGLLEFMDLNDTVTVIIDVFSRFESSWTGMTHPHKCMDPVCTYVLL